MTDVAEKPKKKRAPRTRRDTAGMPIRTLADTADEMLKVIDASFTASSEYGTGSNATMEPPHANPLPNSPDVVPMAYPTDLSGQVALPVRQWEPVQPTQSGGLPLSVQDATSLLDPRTRIAASLQATAGARLSTWEIARAAGIKHTEFLKLRNEPAYINAVTAILVESANRATHLAVSHRAYRLSTIQADLDRLNQITSQRGAAADMRYASRDEAWLEARGVVDPAAFVEQFPQVGEMFDPSNPECYMFDPDDVFVPGATTGLLVKDKKTVGAGLAAQVVDVWQLDSALIKERQNLLKQAAQEVGEWGPSGDKGETAPLKLYIGIDMNRL